MMNWSPTRAPPSSPLVPTRNRRLPPATGTIFRGSKPRPIPVGWPRESGRAPTEPFRQPVVITPLLPFGQ